MRDITNYLLAGIIALGAIFVIFAVLDQASCGLDDMNTIDEDGYHPLHKAVRERNRQQAKCLINAGVDLNLVSIDGSTALHDAIYNDSEVAKMLIKAGANVNIKDSRGGLYGSPAPLHIAVSVNNPEIVKMLIEAGAWVNAMSVVSLDLGTSFFPNSISRYTPLDYAIRNENKRLIVILQNAGGICSEEC